MFPSLDFDSIEILRNAGRTESWVRRKSKKEKEKEKEMVGTRRLELLTSTVSR